MLDLLLPSYRRFLWFVGGTLLLLACDTQKGEELQAGAIIKKMIQTYSELSSYQDKGTIEVTMGSQSNERKRIIEFSIAFQRPSLLTVEWIESDTGMTNPSYLSSDGKQTLIYFGNSNQYVTFPSLEMGIAGATGISMGATQTVLPLLLGTSPLTALSNLQFVGHEDLDGTQCYVISGKIRENVSYRFWIDTRQLLLQRVEQSVLVSKQMRKSLRDKVTDPENQINLNDLSRFNMVSQVRHRAMLVNNTIPENILNPALPHDAKVNTDLSKLVSEYRNSSRAMTIPPRVDQEETLFVDFSHKEIEYGKEVYEKHCLWCHGSQGDGKGPAEPYLSIKPRNFQQGIFKIRSTLPSNPPTDGDLVLTVKHGLPGSTMPAYENVLSNKEQQQVVGYITRRLVKNSGSKKVRQHSERIDYGQRSVPTTKSIERGKSLYAEVGCAQCHGAEGRGDGTLTLKDQWGFLTLPTDLTKAWNFRGNRRDPYNPAHVYRAITAGLSGTPMPSYSERLSIEERWDLVNYVTTLSPRFQIMQSNGKPTAFGRIKSNFIAMELPREPDDPAWKGAKEAYIPLVNNIVLFPRHFVNAVDDIRVRSLHNEMRIAFLIEWNDRTQSRQTDNRSPFYDSVALNIVQEAIDLDDSKRRVFNDAIAIQFPQQWQDFIPPQPKIDRQEFLKENREIGDSPLKDKIDAAQFSLPYFLFGDRNKGVDLWKWDSSGRVNLFSGNGTGNMNVRQTGESNLVYSQASYRNGRWRVVFSRSLTTKDSTQDVQFERGRQIPIVFFAWDGDAGESGTKMAFSSFQYLMLMPLKEGNPIQLRTVHPLAPKETLIKGTPFLIKEITNPFRRNETNLEQTRHLRSQQDGATVYFGKGACFLCHGANLAGEGIYSSALSPYPTNFMDLGSSLQFQESYVFWRVAKGSLDLPSHSHPWASTMPAGEEFLTIDEMWKVVLFLYSRTERTPASWH